MPAFESVTLVVSDREIRTGRASMWTRTVTEPTTYPEWGGRIEVARREAGPLRAQVGGNEITLRTATGEATCRVTRFEPGADVAVIEVLNTGPAPWSANT